jgi:hypothetical protein
MDQNLLFSEAEIAPPPRPQPFVFEKLDERDLFENSTCLFTEEFVDGVVCNHGFYGNEAAREMFVAQVAARLIKLFVSDQEFAARIGSAEDPRPELQELVIKWLREDPVQAARRGPAA